MDEKFTVGVIVSNHAGVLNRVSALYSKRGYNIDSLAVGVTENPLYSRITIVSTGDDYMKDQVVRQLRKLHDVKLVVLLPTDSSVGVEHMLVKMKADGDSKARISALINTYAGKVMDFGQTFITAEITGDSEKIDKFTHEAEALGILELCRSGLISLAHGDTDILDIKNL